MSFRPQTSPGQRNSSRQLFGWKFTDDGPDYTSFEDGRIAGGFSKSDKCSTIAAGGVLIVFYHPRLEEVRERVLALILPREQLAWSGWVYFSMAVLVPLHSAYWKRRIK